MRTSDALLQKAEEGVSVKEVTAALRQLWTLTRDAELAAMLGRLNPVSLGRKPAQVLATLKTLSDGAELSAALEQLLREVPFTSDTSKPAWREVLRAVSRTGSPHFRTLAARLPEQWTIRPLMKDWLAAQLRTATSRLPETCEPLPPNAAPRLRAIEKKWETKSPAVDTTPLDAVYREPASDAVRMVCADALQSQGDPRGEFIALQLADTAMAQKRARALLKAHLETWLSPFEGAVAKGSAVFRRGFLTEAVVRFRNQEHAERIGNRPEWATVERLRFQRGSTSQSLRKWTGFVSPAMKSLRDVAMGGEAFAFLNAATFPIETLVVHVATEEAFSNLLQMTTLPALRTIDVTHSAPDRWVEAVVKSDIQTVRLNGRDFSPKVWKKFEASNIRHVIIQSAETAELRLARGGDGWSLELFHGDRVYPYPLIELLKELKGRLRKVSFADLAVMDAEVVAAARATSSLGI